MDEALGAVELEAMRVVTYNEMFTMRPRWIFELY